MTSIQQPSLIELLKKRVKTLEDAYIIFEHIKNFQFFDSFSSQNLRTMDQSDMIYLCQGLKYERVTMGRFACRRGWSNNRFYVLLSGEVGLIRPHLEYMAPEGSELQEPPAKSRLNKLFNTIKALSKMEKSKLNTAARKLKRSNQISLYDDATFEDGDQERVMFKGARALIGTDFSLPAELMAKIEQQDKLVLNFFETGENFEQFAFKYGCLNTYIGEGEGFGDLGIPDIVTKSESLLCKTDCEFLMITKERFESLLLKKEGDKEEFLREVFPFLDDAFSSSVMLKSFFSLFKVEAYSKGSYLAMEGKIEDREPCLYIISRGECLVEKTFTKDEGSSHAPKYSGHIAKIGRGTFVGEEILFQSNEYNYSIKATVENVVAYRIFKIDFESINVKEFHDFVSSMYTKKSKQRELVCENMQRDFESKAEQKLKEKSSSFKSTNNLNHLLTKSAMRGMSRKHIFAQSFLSPADPSASGMTPPISPRQQPQDQDKAREGSLYKQRFHRDSTISQTVNKPQKIEIKTIDVENIYEPSLNRALQESNPMISAEPQYDSIPIISPEEKAFENGRLFIKNDRRKARNLIAAKSKLSELKLEDPTAIITNTTPQKKSGLFSSGGSLMNGFDKGFKRDTLHSRNYVNINHHKNGEQKASESKGVNSLSPVKAKNAGSPDVMRKANKSIGNSLFKDDQTKLASTLTSNFFPSRIKIPDVVNEPSSVKGVQRALKKVTGYKDGIFATPQHSPTNKDSLLMFDEFEKPISAIRMNMPRRHLRASSEDPKDKVKKDLLEDLDEIFSNIGTSRVGLKSPSGDEFAKTTHIGFLTKGSRLHKQVSPHNSQVLNMRDWRIKVFKKAVIKPEIL